MALLNIQGLKPRTVPTKVPFIHDLLVHNKLLFIALTETWLRDHLDAEVNIDGYKIFRQDRVRTRLKRRGCDVGGTACYLKNSVAADTNIILNFSNEAIDVLGLHIKLKNLVLFIVYRQPDDKAGGRRSTSDHFKEALGKLHDIFMQLPKPTPDIILCGDFNLPYAVWPEGSIKSGASKDEQIMINDLVMFKNEFYLTQEILKPTHKKGNVLDLFFTNNSEMLHSYESNEILFSDHYLVEGKLNYDNNECCKEKKAFTKDEKGFTDTKLFTENFNQFNFFSENINWKTVNNELQKINWRWEFRRLSPEEMLSRLYSNCFSVCEKYIPLKRKTMKSTRSEIPRVRKNLMRNRKQKLNAISVVCSSSRKAKLQAEVRN